MKQLGPILVLLALPLSACAQGDFGRPAKPLFFNNFPSALAEKNGDAAVFIAQVPFTDAERRMRDIGYNLLYAPDIAAVFTERMSIHRIAPASLPLDREPGGYYARLLQDKSQSSAARHKRLISDMRKDRDALRRFRRPAERVLDADDLRAAVLGKNGSLNPQEKANAKQRMEENRAFIEAVFRALEAREADYAYAVRHLAVAAPEPWIAESDEALVELKAERGRVAAALLPRARATVQRKSGSDAFRALQKEDGEQENSLANPR